MHNFTAVPLTPHRHTGLDLISSKLLKPLGSGLGFGVLRRPTAYIHIGLRRNNGEMLLIFMSPRLPGILLLKRYANYNKTKSS